VIGWKCHIEKMSWALQIWTGYAWSRIKNNKYSIEMHVIKLNTFLVRISQIDPLFWKLNRYTLW
jgi:hypothetical protein